MIGLTLTNSIFNRYTVGSGVGSINSSNRAALKRRAYKPLCNDIAVIEKEVRYVKVFFRGTDGIIQISQLAVYVNGVNIAPNGSPSAANTYENLDLIGKPIDGTLSVRTFPDIYHSSAPSGFGYWLLDLGQAYVVDTIVYYNRDNNSARANGMLIETYDTNYDNNSPGDSVPLNQFILNGDLIQTLTLQETPNPV